MKLGLLLLVQQNEEQEHRLKMKEELLVKS